IERGARADRRRVHARERRACSDGFEETLRRRRRPFDVDVLRRGTADAIPELMKKRRASTAARAEQDRNARWCCVEGSKNPSCQCRSRRQHGEKFFAAEGTRAKE